MIDDPLVFLAQPDSIIVTDVFAKRNSLALDNKLAMRTMDGEKQFTDSRNHEIGRVGQRLRRQPRRDGHLRRAKSFWTRQAFRPDRFAVKEASDCGGRPAETRIRPRAGIPGGIADGQGCAIRIAVPLYSVSADLTSAFALFIGLFIIFNTFSIAVAQRSAGNRSAADAGRHARADSRPLFRRKRSSGLVGLRRGIALGLLIARAMAGFIGTYLGEVYGVAQRTDEIIANPGLLLIALAMGVATSLIAAVIPARNAARVDPVLALQQGRGADVLRSGEPARERMCRADPTGRPLLPLIALYPVPCRCLCRASDLTHCRRPASGARRSPSWLTKLLRPLLGWIFAGGRNAGRRQPDPIAAPDLRRAIRADAVAGAGDRSGRTSPAPVITRSRTGWMSHSIPIFSSPLRSRSRRAVFVSRARWATCWPRFPASPKCRVSARRA